MSKDHDLLSGLEYFDGGSGDDHDRHSNIDQSIQDYHTLAAQGTIQVLNIIIDDTVVPVLIKNIEFVDGGGVSVEFISTNRDYPEQVLWPHVTKAISIQVDNILNQKPKGFISNILNFIKGVFGRGKNNN